MSTFTTAVITASLFTTSLIGSMKFAYNTENGDRQEITSQTVYQVDRSGKYLQQHLKYEFTYDEEERVTEKEILKWDKQSQQWEKTFRLTYHYHASGHTLELSKWNRETEAYGAAVEKAHYLRTENNHPEIYESYHLDEVTQEWNLTLAHLIEVNDQNLWARNQTQ